MRKHKDVDNDIFVMLVIYNTTIVKKEKLWYGKLVKLVEGILTERQVSDSFDVLTDWLIIKGGYGSTGDGRAGWIIQLNDDYLHIPIKLYDKYWIN